MSRELSTLQPAAQSSSKQLNTTMRRSQRSQVSAMVRLADRLVANIEQDGLTDLIGGFRAFAADYAAMLDKANESGQLSFLLRSGIERLLQEWNILSRACEQRNEPNPKYMRVADRQQSVRNYLDMADKQLSGYCERWRPPAHTAYTSLQTPVAYFEKLYRISRALFAPGIPVVSIPLPDYDAPDRWQALGHEMGHHVFWNGVTLDEFSALQSRLRQAVADAVLKRLGVTDYSNAPSNLNMQRIDLWGHWLEEVFADVCGVLFAGPAFAYSAQELAAASVSTLDDLVGADDQTHPSLYLRPLIALQVIREIAGKLHDVDAKYAAALLGWAGAGDTETQRRAPGFDDFLKTNQPDEWMSGKRTPADLTVSRGAILTGDERWQRFTASAADMTHRTTDRTTDIPLTELKADVPVVVQALLTAPVWPEGKCLWDLVEFYGLRPGDRNVAELKEWSTLFDISTRPAFPPIPDLSSLPAGDFKPVALRMADVVGKSTVTDAEKPRAFWILLSALNVESESAGLYQPHTNFASDHSHLPEQFWALFTKQHKHDAIGSTISGPWVRDQD